MSLHDRAVAAILAQLSLAADGALLGLGVAYVAYRCIRKLTATSSALRKIQQAPCVQPSDLRSILPVETNSHQNPNVDGEKLVIVRGSVEVKSSNASMGNWNSLKGGNSNVLVSQETAERGVILQRTQTCGSLLHVDFWTLIIKLCIYNEWRAFGWTTDLRSILSKSWHKQESSTIRMVPFILVEPGKWPQSDYVMVNMEGSRHPLPLTTVYHLLQPINASPYTFLQAFLGLEYPIGLLDEEKILRLGEEITAVGICKLKNGTPEIKSCNDLPYFLCDLTKDQILADLSFKAKVLMWSGIIFGSLAVGILGYSVARNWVRWKQQRARQQTDSNSSETPAEIPADDEPEEVLDGELCVVCLTRIRRSAFIPCGHMVCCQRCAFAVEREVSPKCPVCRQSIRGSVRIYDS